MTVKGYRPPGDIEWEKNFVQFPRLIAEISATQELDLDEIAKGMDLPVERVVELFNRADDVWERIKRSK